MSLWPESPWWVVSETLGVALVICGLILAFKERVVVNEAGAAIDVRVPGWRFATRSSALAVLAFGVVFFFGPPVSARWSSPETLRARGRIFLHDGKIVNGLQGATIGILPTGIYTTTTDANGNYTHDFPKGRDGQSYQAVVLSNTTPPLFGLGVVEFPQGSKEGTFDHVLHRSSGK
jgi:hypothetical protein